MESFLQKLQAAGRYCMSLWATPEREEAPPFRRFFLRLGILLIGYVFLDRILTRATTLPAESYQEPIIYLAFLKHIFSGPYAAIFLPVIFFLFYFYRRLGSPWAILPLFKSLRLLVVLVAGTLAWFFSTYGYQFTLSRFSYLAPQPILTITWGAIADAGIAHFLTEATSPEQVLAFEKIHGVTHYDETLKISFDTFLKQYLQQWNNRLSKHTLLSYIKAPRLLWTFPEKFTADQPEPIRKVIVTQVTTYYHDNHYAEIRKIPVHQILIPR